MSNVVNITPDLVEDFKQKKYIRDLEDTVELDLEPVRPGEKVIGRLTPNETEILLEVLVTDDEIQQLMHTETIKSVETLLSKLKKTIDAIGEVDVPITDKDTLKQFYKLKDKHCFLKDYLFYIVKDRLNCFGSMISFRKDYIVVEVGRYY